MTNVNGEENRNVCSNFSIDHILNRAGSKTCNTIPYNEQAIDQNQSSEFDFRQINIVLDDGRYPYEYHWLNCTRYHPPKLQRPLKREGAKRQPGRHPRIPFTVMQIDILEESYKKSPYLCPEEVSKLSKQLILSDTRIKIWFQNRRAREKREKDNLLQR